MKTWTYGELKDKVLVDMDLQDELQVQPDEFAGYCNEAIDEAEAEILTLNEDYFLTFTPFDFVAGQANYPLPDDCYGAKLRGFVYQNGSTVYLINRFRNYRKFERIADAENFDQGDDYRYLLHNPSPRSGYQMEIVPTPVASGTFGKLWYIRNAQRIPLLNEWAIQEELLASQIDFGADTITVENDCYVTGDQVKLSPESVASTLPSPLVAGTIYFVIRAGVGVIKLATSLVNAEAGTAIDLADAGTGIFILEVKSTEATRRELPVDIPEFANFLMQFMKVRCLEKDGTDPRFDTAVAILQQQRKMMVDTLTQMVPDNDDVLEGDFSHYEEHS